MSRATVSCCRAGGRVLFALAAAWIAAGGSSGCAPAGEGGATSSDALSERPACPAPFVPHGSQCVLRGDATLAATVEVAPFTHLNCQGHRLSPALPGVVDDPATPANEYAPSQPSTGLLLVGAYGAKVQSCVLDGFDFGVVALKAKIPSEVRDLPEALGRVRPQILNNTVRAKYRGVVGGEVDNFLVSGNVVEMTHPLGAGILFEIDCDQNEIVQNTVIGAAGEAAGLTPNQPGGAAVSTGSSRAQGIRIAGAVPTLDGNLLSFIVAGKMIQLAFDPERLPEDNVIAGNTVTIRSGLSLAGISSDQATVRTRIVANHVESPLRTGSAILRGILTSGRNVSLQIPSACSGDTARRCLRDSDCSLPGIDGVSQGTCSGVATQDFNLRTVDTAIEQNEVHGFRVGISPANAVGSWVRGNMITGVGEDAIFIGAENGRVEGNLIASPARGGIYLASLCFNSCVVTRNQVHGARLGLMVNTAASVSPGAPLSMDTAGSGRARVYLNDFVGTSEWPAMNGRLSDNTPAAQRVALSADFDLSDAGQGNHWGRPCTDGAGFREATALRPPLGSADAIDPHLFDSDPYGEPVAALELPPPPCAGAGD